MPSGGSVANVTISDTQRSTRTCEQYGLKVLCRERTTVTCPTIYFVPALPAYVPGDVSYLVACTESA